ncbi:MAG TPA: hypothetical protein VLE91_00115 [Candidatus Saccharimonadales bacterium]|nr:hypothetical protein [Candidatus Saccharimonadales bacterium]
MNERPALPGNNRQEMDPRGLVYDGVINSDLQWTTAKDGRIRVFFQLLMQIGNGETQAYRVIVDTPTLRDYVSENAQIGKSVMIAGLTEHKKSGKLQGRKKRRTIKASGILFI